MLFFPNGQAKGPSREFTSAMNSLIKRGMVIQERHKGAFSLTPSGYRASLSAERNSVATEGRAKVRSSAS